MGTSRSTTILKLRPAVAVLFTAILMAVSAATAPSSSAQSAPPAAADGWQSDKSFSLSFLGRDGAQGPDRYHVIFGYGASFFGIAVNSMPLLPAEQSVRILMDGYGTAFPGRPAQDVQPDDGFDFLVPLGTIVSSEWKKSGSTIEYRSLRGDDLVVYSDPKSLVSYRLSRVEDPTRAEVVINKDAELRSLDLARAVYGAGNPNFKPDVLQVARASKAISEGQTSISVDTTKAYLDDFPQIRGSAEPGGKTADGLDIYWFRSDQVAQPLFRVDDAVGQTTDPSGLPSLMRVYYYKNGVVRTYQRAQDTVMLSGRQPRNDEWAQVYADYGKLDPAPNHWENAQFETDAAAQELNQLGIVVLRYEPKDAPKSNLFTQFLDWLMGLMKRKQS